MTRRNFSKILVILIVLPIAVRAWQRFSELGEPVVSTKSVDSPPGELQIDEGADLSTDAPAERSENE